MNTPFAKEVKIGLTSSPKNLPSKYFYDEKGSVLFRQIMQSPEYYLTDAEFEIFNLKSNAIIKALGIDTATYFELIELGAGDGYKTNELLTALEAGIFAYNYFPIDISQKALNQLMSSTQDPLLRNKIIPQQGDYFEILTALKVSTHPKIILFLGSNIGNMDDHTANHFLIQLSQSLSKGDHLILGTDLKKSADIIKPAYNDSQGITRQFNLNLLDRINRELGGDINVAQFEHAPDYDEESGIASSSIQSKKDQVVYLNDLDIKITFEKGERIHTEISRKYDDEIITKITRNTGFRVKDKLMDSKNYFADYILEKEQ